jgi:hypothetical protein
MMKPRIMRWAGYVVLARYEKCINIFVGKPERMRPFADPRHRWEDNIKVDGREIWLKGLDWIHKAEDRGRWLAFTNTAVNCFRKTRGIWL